MNDALGSPKNPAAATTSSGWPIRCIELASVRLSIRASVSTSRNSLASVVPSDTTFAVVFDWATSMATNSVETGITAVAPAQNVPFRVPTRSTSEKIKLTRPPPSSRPAHAPPASIFLFLAWTNPLKGIGLQETRGGSMRRNL
jgi:hypothetical protein